MSSGGAAAVNTALFIQNSVQLRNLFLMNCEINDTKKHFRECFTTQLTILFILICLSLFIQVVYAVYLVIGKIFCVFFM